MSHKLDEVDLYDWDTSFAIRYADANKAIVGGWPKVDKAAKQATRSDEGYSITADLGPWQLCEGGDGRNVWMTIPVTSGSLTGPEMDIDLADAVFEVEINLGYVPDPRSAQVHQLLADPSGDATNVRGLTGVKAGDIEKSIAKQVFNAWLGANLGAFNHVFHSLDLSDTVATDPEWSFIQPTSVSYAVTDKGSLETSVFGVLTMTGNHETPANHQVSSDAIPVGCNSGFNIAGPIFTSNMLLTGAALQFEQPGSVTSLPLASHQRQAAFDAWVAASFDIANDGMSVTNIHPMTLGHFTDDGGKVRTMTVAGSDFKLSVNYGFLEIDFTDLSYEYEPGIDVSINYKQHFTVSLTRRTSPDGTSQGVFTLSNVDRDCSVSITKSKAVEERQIGLYIGLSIAGAVLGGLAGDAIATAIKGAGAAAAAGASEGAAGAVTLTVIDGATDVAGPSIELTTTASAEAVAEVTTGTGGRMAGCLARLAPKLVGSMVGAGIGAGISAIPDFIGLAARSDFEKLPAFDDFAAKCMAAHTWPGSSGYDLKSTRLASALQMGGDLRW